MAFPLIVTEKGRAALVDARRGGTAAVQIAQIGYSAAAISPKPSDTALAGEFKRSAALAGEAVAADTIHIIARDESADAYTLRAIALYLDDGTLFALYGQAEPILAKTAATMGLIAIDLRFADIDARALRFGDTNFLDPPATTERAGVVALATDAEAEARALATRAVTPANLRRFVRRAGDSLAGSLRFERVDLDEKRLEFEGAGGRVSYVYGNGRAIGAYDSLTGGLWAYDLAGNRFTIRDALAWHSGNDGAGSGLDADLLDGIDSAAFARRDQANSFAGAIRRDPNFYLDMGGPNPQIFFDLGDALVYNRAADSFNFVGGGTTKLAIAASLTSVATDLAVSGQMMRAGLRVWDAGNDGAGSGLDADLLDGFQSRDFLRAATGDWVRSDDGVERFYFARGGATYARITGTVRFQNRASADVVSIDEEGEVSATRLRVRANGDGRGIAVGDDAWIGDVNMAGTVGIRAQGDPRAGYVAFGTAPHALGCAPDDHTLRYAGQPLWHAGNDGAGSGLDADLLDGRQGGDYALRETFAAGLGPDGWQMLPSGLILQWGSAGHSDDSGARRIRFPRAFPNACFQVLVSNAAGGPPAAFHGAGGQTREEVTIYSAMSTGQAAWRGTAFIWLAIGY
ncbi:gp53-like domain-containing protein [Sphingomonas morindae]|uniref:Putative tail fiber protein gp53-like C-terminal domain-containing protein n=1 Tax=Sphingomonas morindae TaxID=1541170 RepID=A0ABY4X715_9SPHN|nr:hypothetical protein [Sphingomonas morindae]USI72712.1 hypothetical protein LHA26_15780 [Sphingomonas morindae]